MFWVFLILVCLNIRMKFLILVYFVDLFFLFVYVVLWCRVELSLIINCIIFFYIFGWFIFWEIENENVMNGFWCVIYLKCFLRKDIIFKFFWLLFCILLELFLYCFFIIYFFKFCIVKLFDSNNNIGILIFVIVKIVFMILMVFCEFMLNFVNVFVFFNFEDFIMRIFVVMFFIRVVIFFILVVLFFIMSFFLDDNFFFIGISLMYLECCYFKLVEVKNCLILKFINIFCVWLDKSICVR